MDAALVEQRQRLRERLRAYTRLAVAYSGGVDSAYLAWEAHQVLGERMLAVLADSPSLPRRHFNHAAAFTQRHGIPLRIVQTHELQKAEYLRNDRARCFHCKEELFRVMEGLQWETDVTLAYGRNKDDEGDFRPGHRAAELRGVVAPLAEAGLGKQEIRSLAREAGLEIWDLPASACLSSRIEFGRPVTEEALRQVEESEDSLIELGFRQVRVRHHGQLARVEIERGELARALSIEMLERITAGVRRAGFTFVALDTEGYRSGSMNALVPVASLTAQKGNPYES
jgi:uncharacterized protein